MKNTRPRRLTVAIRVALNCGGDYLRMIAMIEDMRQFERDNQP
jgi:hypothetical protein